jgi:hypothetical protein
MCTHHVIDQGNEIKVRKVFSQVSLSSMSSASEVEHHLVVLLRGSVVTWLVRGMVSR